MTHSESSPSLACPPETRERNKRKFQGDDQSEMRSFMAEMRMQFNNFAINQDKQLAILQETVKVIREQNAEMVKSVEFVSQKYDDLTTRLNKMEKEREHCIEYVASLEQRVEYLEKKSRATYLEIRNIPSTQGENKEQLCSLIGVICDVLKTPIDKWDIRDIYRSFSKSSENKPIVVELSSVLVKNQLLIAYKNFNKLKGAERLNTQHIRRSGSPKIIYISESLTPKLKRLFYLSREYAKQNDFNYCWTSGGSVYLRKRDGSAHIRISAETDLSKIAENK